jgi:Thrombospondin type 3 repeat
MKWILPTALLLAVAFVPTPSSANASQPFQPAYNIISVNPSTPSAHGTVSQHIGVPATDHVLGSLKYTLPAGWDIANVESNDLPIVGTGLLLIDVDQSGSGGPPCDSVMETYALTIVDTGSSLQDPPEVETNWAVQGYPFQTFPFTVKIIAGTQRIESLMFQNPPNVCAMTTLDLTFQGISTDNPSTPEPEAGRNVLTNPGSAGVYTWSIEFKSKPLGEPGVHTAVRCDQAGINATPTDTDGDGIANTCDNCPTTANATQLNWDEDSTGDVCDSDIDGDAVANASDQCAFTPLGQSVDVNGCSQSQVDQDLDGVCDPGKSSPSWCTGSDNCPTSANPTQANVVHPLTLPGDACDDPEVDGWADSLDNCPDNYNPFQEDGDLDGRGNLCDLPVACTADPDCDNDNVSDGPADPDAGGPIVAGPDNCLLIPNTNQLNQDADTLGNACDNCPTVTNQSQVNIDGDSFGDACDAGDFDGDFFSDRIEYFAGTDRGASCPLNQSHNAWPPDINNNGSVDVIADISAVAGVAFQSVPPAPARYDIAPDPPNGSIGVIDDISLMAGYFAQSCPP